MGTAAPIRFGQVGPMSTKIVSPTLIPVDDLELHAVAVATAERGVKIKYQVCIGGPPHSEALFDMNNYGKKILCFAAPDGTMLTSFPVEIVPEDSIRPSRKYQFYDAFRNIPISSEISLNVISEEDEESKQLIGSAGVVQMPDLTNGSYTLRCTVSDFDHHDVKLVSYNGLVGEHEVSRIFLNPSGSIVAGQIRAVLSWGKDPSDLDLHCFSSKGEHVYFVRKKDKNLNLDIDVATGFGPETLTVNVEAGVSYYFYVHHFAGEGSLATSGAKLKVYGVPGIDTVYIPWYVSFTSVSFTHPRGPLFWLLIFQYIKLQYFCSNIKSHTIFSFCLYLSSCFFYLSLASVPYGNQYKGYWQVFSLDGTGHVNIVNDIVRDTRGAQSGRKF